VTSRRKTPGRNALAPEHRDRRAKLKRLRLVQEAIPQAVAAQEELRPHAAEWVSGVRARILSLWKQVDAVREAVRAGSPLGKLLPVERLNDLAAELERAGHTVTGLMIGDYDVPVPNLLAHVRSVARQFPLAAEGGRALAESDDGASG
jgi:hypothetical protein